MDTSNKSIERAYLPGKKSDNKKKAIVVQFLFYKDKTNILRNCKKLKGTKITIFEDLSQETIQIRKEKWKELPGNKKQSEIPYLQYVSVICKEGRPPVQPTF